jgi:hypothetical protein
MGLDCFDGHRALDRPVVAPCGASIFISELTQDFRPGLLSVAPAGADILSAHIPRNPRGVQAVFSRARAPAPH